MADAFSPELARKPVDLRADAETQARVDVLAAKANAGLLTSAEEDEYRDSIKVADIVGVM